MLLSALHGGSVKFASCAARADTTRFMGLFVGLGKCDPTIDDALLRHGVKDIIALVSKSCVPQGVGVGMRDIGQHSKAVQFRGFTRGRCERIGSHMCRYSASVHCM